MNLQSIIDNPTATLEQLEGADQELTQRLARFEAQRALAETKKLSIAKSATPEKDAASLVADLQAIELMVSGAQQLQVSVRNRIVTIEAERTAAAAAQARATRQAERRELRRLRNAAIDKAEAAFAEAAKQIREALRISAIALETADSKPSFHVGGEIVAGLKLVPALTQRCWLQAGFSDPRIQAFDNLFAHQAPALSKVFAFECDQLDLPQE